MRHVDSILSGLITEKILLLGYITIKNRNVVYYSFFVIFDSRAFASQRMCNVKSLDLISLDVFMF